MAEADDSTRMIEETEAKTDSIATGDPEGPYEYTALRSDGNQIRVLSIEPSITSDASDDTLLQCNLKHVDLDDWTYLYREWLSARMKDPQSNHFRNFTKSHAAAWHLRNDPAVGKEHEILAATTISEDVTDWNPNDCMIRCYENYLQCSNASLFPKFEKMDRRFRWGDYIALSYVWGDPEQRRNILLDGQRFSVTSNLYYALLHLRKSFEVRRMYLYVWIDAICINQNDLDERMAQVKKMGKIYSSALAVRAFLGQPDQEIVPKIRMLRSILDAFIQTHPEEEESYDKIVRLGPEDSLWNGMAAMIFLPYWRRQWIIQEIALAPAVLFAYGDQTFSAGCLYKGCELVLYGLSNRMFDEFDPCLSAIAALPKEIVRVVTRLGQLRTIMSGLRDLELLDLIHFAKESTTTDPRDKVFSMLALLPIEVAARIRPDYGPAFSELDAFVMFSKSCYQVAGNLNLLAQDRKIPLLTQDIPTWALNLREIPDLERHSCSQDQYGEFEANLRMPLKEIEFTDDNRFLYCNGVIVDDVNLLGALGGRGGVQLDTCHTHQEPPAPTNFTHQEWRLILARVLLQDSSFEFSGSPSILDVPWLDFDGLGPGFDLELNFKDIMKNFYSKETDRNWPVFFKISGIFLIFYRLLWGNETLRIGDRSLKSYFESTDRVCSDPVGFRKLRSPLFKDKKPRRLCFTRNGLLGTVPDIARLDDKIAILSACDAPIVLRPRGDSYEVIGSCFVEGLMKGEVATGIEQGRFKIQGLSLC